MGEPKRRALDYYLNLRYPFQVIADSEGGYVITFPDLPGCITQVDRLDEIAPMAEEARTLWITTEYEEGEDIPPPTYREVYSGKFNLRLPRSLHRRLAEMAEREGISLNQCVVTLLSRADATYSRSSKTTATAMPKPMTALRSQTAPKRRATPTPR